MVERGQIRANAGDRTDSIMTVLCQPGWGLAQRQPNTQRPEFWDTAFVPSPTAAAVAAALAN